MIEQIPADWRAVLAVSIAQPWLAELEAFVVEERLRHTVYPDTADVFNSLRLTPFASVRAVILGQDPYPRPNHADGLAFSVRSGVVPPRSLHNILSEWARDLGHPITGDGSLVAWAQHGVLLLSPDPPTHRV